MGAACDAAEAAVMHSTVEDGGIDRRIRHFATIAAARLRGD
jgi:hypothetical protein